jgi:tetratricopeptide (TPR) repeat protein
MKRTERHHLKEDEIRTGLNWFLQFYEDYKREVTIGAGVLLFAAAVFGGLLLVRSHIRAVQSRAVSEVLSLGQGLEGKPANLTRLEALADKGQGPAARLACLELAAYWAGKGDTGKAGQSLDRIAPTPRDLLYYQAEALKARLLVQNKEYDKAIAIYRKVRDEKPSVYPLDAVLFSLAEAYELAGRKDEALALYAEIRAEYPQTYYGEEASTKAGRLGLQK